MSASNKETYVIFKLEKEFYGLDIKNVLSIEKIDEYTRVPNTQAFVMGVINLRGEVVPIIDLKRKLGVGKTTIDSDTRVIVVSDDDIVVGFVVEHSSEVLEIENENIDRPPVSDVNKLSGYIKGVGRDNDRLIMIMDPVKLLSD